MANNEWDELNLRLKDVEAGEKGLTGALAALETHQLESGFIKHRVVDVLRERHHHPEDSERFLQVQYNPERSVRHKGAGVQTPRPGQVSVNDGCFLCRQNISWQQQGRQLGYQTLLGETPYHAWMNPFPLLDGHVVFASEEHIRQDYGIAEADSERLARVLNGFCGAAEKLPHHVGFFNGVGAGASVPHHLHFHYAKRPEGVTEFPIEQAINTWRQDNGDEGVVENYPLPIVFWTGNRTTVVSKACEWFGGWFERNTKRLETLSGNLIATAKASDEITLSFVPRDQTIESDGIISGAFGGLEVMGEIVYSTPDHKALLDEGKVDYLSLESHLLHARTPLDPAA